MSHWYSLQTSKCEVCHFGYFFDRCLQRGHSCYCVVFSEWRRLISTIIGLGRSSRCRGTSLREYSSTDIILGRYLSPCFFCLISLPCLNMTHRHQSCHMSLTPHQHSSSKHDVLFNHGIYAVTPLVLSAFHYFFHR
jgi:hypothetical protein